ncbi:hypothetical protein F4777DRAFT_550469 [Nemania sp. FL0916]|nr:hypothetical protein F4777DRAFT_550469 [Nemania sp. FL0916]
MSQYSQGRQGRQSGNKGGEQKNLLLNNQTSHVKQSNVFWTQECEYKIALISFNCFESPETLKATTKSTSFSFLWKTVSKLKTDMDPKTCALNGITPPQTPRRGKTAANQRRQRKQKHRQTQSPAAAQEDHYRNGCQHDLSGLLPVDHYCPASEARWADHFCPCRHALFDPTYDHYCPCPHTFARIFFDEELLSEIDAAARNRLI